MCDAKNVLVFEDHVRQSLVWLNEMCCCTHLALCDDFTTSMEWPEVVTTFLALFFHAFSGVFVYDFSSFCKCSVHYYDEWAFNDTKIDEHFL